MGRSDLLILASLSAGNPSGLLLVSAGNAICSFDCTISKNESQGRTFDEGEAAGFENGTGCLNILFHNFTLLYLRQRVYCYTNQRILCKGG